MLPAPSRFSQPIETCLAFWLLLFGGMARGSDYERDVKPLLEEKCYACHGALKQAGGLRLDTAEHLIAGGESGSALNRGEPDESLLIAVLTGEAGFQMPPAAEGSPLSREQINLLRDWIGKGAPHPADETAQQDPRLWWSYQPVQRPDLPSDDHNWSRNSIDHFIAAKREEIGLPFVGEATKAVWLRRVYLDLIGLPPTRQEQRDFAMDASPTAYERVVDDLLSRPQYGERWGRHWMDIWRYSDWYGSRGINEIRYSQRHIWRWRDWIVESLNRDKGYDQMVAEMIAGDEIGRGDPSVMAATGFLGRNWYKFDRDAWMFETVERTSEAFLGMTMRCCRCHDHKFDPVTQEEYYRFRAIFEPHDVRTDPISAFTPREKDATLGQVLSDGIATVYDKSLDAVTYRFERGDSRFPDTSQIIEPSVPAALGGDFLVQPIELPVEAWYPSLRPHVRQSLQEKSKLAVAEAVKSCEAATDALTQATNQLDAFAVDETNRPEPSPLLFDNFNTPRPEDWETVSGTWQYSGGRLVQSQVTSFATIVSKREIRGDFKIRLQYRTLDPGTYRSVGFSFDYLDAGNSQDVYTSTGDQRQSVQAFHRTEGRQVYPADGIVATPLSVDSLTLLEATVSGSQLTIDLNGERMLDYSLPMDRRDGKFAIWVHQGAAEFLEAKITPLATTRAMLEAARRDAQHALDLANAELEYARAESDSLMCRIKAEVAQYCVPSTLGTDEQIQDAVAAERRAAVCKARLEVLRAANSSSEKQVDAEKALQDAIAAEENLAGEYSSVGMQFPRSTTGRRAALARWLTDPSNPRTARVAANHLWSRHFGIPLVETTENFGLNGRTPSHPELLDWLASELVASDWKMKPLHKLMVLSATYRLAGSFEHPHERIEDHATANTLDATNRYYWRMHSRRMEAEVVRDATLHIAKQLQLELGGAAIEESKGEEIPRRSLYFRNTPNESMLLLDVLDVADPNACYRRKESIVPHQSLAMMNSGLSQDAAREIARQITTDDVSGAQFVEAAFEIVLARAPRKEERIRCEAFLIEHARRLQQPSQERFSAGGTAKSAPASEPFQRARENLVHVLLMHNDFVTIR